MFIICESIYTHSGKPKKLYLTDNIEKFANYRDKIYIVINTRKHFTKNPWVRERRQRQLISKYLKRYKFDKNDIIIHSDCDEIPSAKIIESLKLLQTSKNFILELRNFHNFLNLQNGIWQRGRVVSGDKYKSINLMMQDIFLFNNLNSRRHNLPIIRVPDYFSNRFFYFWKFPKVIFNFPKIDILYNAGWHFNNLFTIEDIFEKIMASTHTELVTKDLLEVVETRYKSHMEIYTGKELDIINIDLSFPSSITENLSNWQDYILPIQEELKS
jgi:hypothetical protein